MPAPSLPTLALVVLVPLVAWRMYARFRRLVGRQRLSRVRPWISLTVFPALVLVLAYVVRANAQTLAALGGTLTVGALLARYGLSRTRFEVTQEGVFYTPHAPLGIALSVLFAGRILYRIFELIALPPGAVPDFTRSPLTLAIFGLLAGYYVSYAMGLVRWRWAHERRRQD